MLKHQTQTRKDNCVSASIAMLTGWHVDKVTAEFHKDYQEYVDVNESTYLHAIGLRHIELSAFFRTPRPGNIYLATVPSLNIVAGSHEIVIHFTKDGEFLVLDPNQGCEGAKYYVNGPITNEWEIQLASYQCCVEVSEADLTEWRSHNVKG